MGVQWFTLSPHTRFRTNLILRLSVWTLHVHPICVGFPQVFLFLPSVQRHACSKLAVDMSEGLHPEQNKATLKN